MDIVPPMKPFRSVIDIICNLLEVIPKDELKLITEIENYKNTLWNKSPEALKHSYCWVPLTTIMENNISFIDTDWKKQLIAIFNNE